MSNSTLVRIEITDKKAEKAIQDASLNAFLEQGWIPGPFWVEDQVDTESQQSRQFLLITMIRPRDVEQSILTATDRLRQLSDSASDVTTKVNGRLDGLEERLFARSEQLKLLFSRVMFAHLVMMAFNTVILAYTLITLVNR